jgi:hypothetical protein
VPPAATLLLKLRDATEPTQPFGAGAVRRKLLRDATLGERF